MELIRPPRCTEKTGLSKREIDRREAKGDFPKRVRLGPNTVAWDESEVDAWIAERLAERAAA